MRCPTAAPSQSATSNPELFLWGSVRYDMSLRGGEDKRCGFWNDARSLGRDDLASRFPDPVNVEVQRNIRLRLPNCPLRHCNAAITEDNPFDLQQHGLFEHQAKCPEHYCKAYTR